jgi:hypothetical protein
LIALASVFVGFLAVDRCLRSDDLAGEAEGSQFAIFLAKVRRPAACELEFGRLGVFDGPAAGGSSNPILTSRRWSRGSSRPLGVS